MYNAQTRLYFFLDTCILVFASLRAAAKWMLANEMAGVKTNDFWPNCFTHFSRPMKYSKKTEMRFVQLYIIQLHDYLTYIITTS